MFEWKERSIQIDAPKKPKKLTGTRFASVLGLNAWNTPFATWCEITRTYEEPFEDTIYTLAGKAIEPKQIEYCKKAFFLNIQTPTDKYGKDYFNKTFGDFFPENDVFGGMWDSLVIDKDGKPCKVIECKTTKRVEDWDGKIPEYYALQATLYAYLLGVDDVIMVASFLDEKDYEHPEKFVPTVNNTVLLPFKVSQRYPNFRQIVDKALKWWNTYVLTGKSPEFDEKKDAETLKALRTNHIDPSKVGIKEIIEELEPLLVEISEHEAKIEDKAKRAKVLQEELKKQAIASFRDGDKKVDFQGKNRLFTVSRSVSVGINKAALEADGLLTKYQTSTETYKITNKIIGD